MLLKRREPPTLAEDELKPASSVLILRYFNNLSQRTRRAIIIAAVAFMVLAILIVPVVGTLLGLKGAADDLRAGASRLEGKGLALTMSDTQAADAHFVSAEQRFRKAESGLRNDPGFRLLSVLPFINRQVEAAIALTRSGARVARAGHDGVVVADRLIAEKVIGPGLHGNPGDIALSVLQALTPQLDPIISELGAAQRERDQVPSGWLFWPIQSA